MDYAGTRWSRLPARVLSAISGTKVRLSGIDTPERKQTCRKASVTWRCGYEATETLMGWTYTREVRCVGDTKDRYGRLIADCFVDGYNINVRLYVGIRCFYVGVGNTRHPAHRSLCPGCLRLLQGLDLGHRVALPYRPTPVYSPFIFI
jgi:hypothetical protein